jgi:predicted DNA repair protein MutK
MATSLLALLDDITTVLDDVSLLAKTAAHKTSGVIGDDLALNAQQVTGVRAERELPVVFAVAKGSLLNKAILVPAALAISAFAPWAVTVLLMVGGAFLCFEGFEKIAHRLLHSKAEDDAHHEELAKANADPAVDLCAVEKQKIKGAIRTDFVLSAEIIAITLGTVADAPFVQQVVVLAGIALAMTVGVYGIVALIVKLDDIGYFLSRRPGAIARGIGAGILRAAPWLMKTLSVVGTAAMFMVGGGILTHGIKAIHHLIENSAEHSMALPYIGSVLAGVLPTLLDAAFGVLAGGLVFVVVMLGGRVFKRGAGNA